jgi:hypothetical protein
MCPYGSIRGRERMFGDYLLRQTRALNFIVYRQLHFVLLILSPLKLDIGKSSISV